MWPWASVNLFGSKVRTFNSKGIGQESVSSDQCQKRQNGKHLGKWVTCFQNFPSSGILGLGQKDSQHWPQRDLPGRAAPTPNPEEAWELRHPTSSLTWKQSGAFCPWDPRQVWPSEQPGRPRQPLQGDRTGPWRARHSNKKPEPVGQRGNWGWKNIFRHFSALKGKKRKKERKPRSQVLTVELVQPWPTLVRAAVDALWGLNCKRQQAFSWLPGRESSLQWQTKIMDLGQV